MGSNRHLASRSVQPLEAGSRKRWKAAKTEQATCTGTQQNARSAQERYRAWAPPGRPSYTGHTGMGVARIFIDFVWELLLQGSFSGGGGPLWYWCFSSFSAACPRVRQRDGEIFPNRSAAGPDQQHLKCVRNEFAIHPRTALSSGARGVHRTPPRYSLRKDKTHIAQDRATCNCTRWKPLAKSITMVATASFGAAFSSEGSKFPRRFQCRAFRSTKIT